MTDQLTRQQLIEQQSWFDGYSTEDMTEYLCPADNRWSWCPGPCPDGTKHTEMRQVPTTFTKIKAGTDHRVVLDWQRNRASGSNS